MTILKEKRATLDKAAEELLQKETLNSEELSRLIDQGLGSDTPLDVAAASARKT